MVLFMHFICPKQDDFMVDITLFAWKRFSYTTSKRIILKGMFTYILLDGILTEKLSALEQYSNHCVPKSRLVYANAIA